MLNLRELKPMLVSDYEDFKSFVNEGIIDFFLQTIAYGEHKGLQEAVRHLSALGPRHHNRLIITKI
jgi:hypothetical protein